MQESQVNMFTSSIQQVTTQSKAKNDASVEKDADRKQTQEWVEEANAKEAAEIQGEKEGPAADLSDLLGCQITMTLEKLLRLVRRFREGLKKSL